jgi:hypothetical protein
MKFNNILEYFKEKNIIIKGWRIWLWMKF